MPRDLVLHCSPEGRLLCGMGCEGAADASFTVTHTVVLGTRTWCVTYFADRHFLGSRRTFAPYTLLIVLTLLSVMVLLGTPLRIARPWLRLSIGVCALMRTAQPAVDPGHPPKSPPPVACPCRNLSAGYVILAKHTHSHAAAQFERESAAARAMALVAQTARLSYEKTLK
jgi:hypothetical protein